MKHKHKVNETKKRSLLKTISGRLIEILVDTVLFSIIFACFGVPFALELASGLAILVEFLCAVATYINERVWNKIQWGREVEDVKE